MRILLIPEGAQQRDAALRLNEIYHACGMPLLGLRVRGHRFYVFDGASVAIAHDLDSAISGLRKGFAESDPTIPGFVDAEPEVTEALISSLSEGCDVPLVRRTLRTSPDAGEVAHKLRQLRQQREAHSDASAARPVHTVLMASGFSKRYGERDKLFERVEGETMIERSIRRVMTVYQHYGNLGWPICCARRAEVLDLAADYGMLALENSGAEEGISASIRLGMALVKWVESRRQLRLDGNALLPSATVFAAADQPYLRVESLIGFYREAALPRTLLMESSDGERSGNPVSFDARYYAELEALRGDCGGKQVFRRHPKDQRRFLVESVELVDVDEQKDLSI